jgi:hypothetical protein
MKVGKSGLKALGEAPSFTTGPGLLSSEHRVPGRFDYEVIPDLRVIPSGGNAGASQTFINRMGMTGIPAHPKSGFPTLPALSQGQYGMSEVRPRPRVDPDVRVRRPVVDPYATPD